MAGYERKWHGLEASDALRELGGSESGLSDAEAVKRLVQYGRNELEEKGGRSMFGVFLGQFKDILVLLLIVSAVFALAAGEMVDGSLILGIVVLNGVFGFIQDYKAERNMDELKKLSKPKAIVIRNGRELEIRSGELVPGDILLLIEGDSVQADGRVIESVNLNVDESSLTGESVPVQKDVAKIPDGAPLAERYCMVYQGTSVVSGRGRIAVASTGMSTELGKIAKDLDAIEDERTPFQKHMDELGGKIAVAILGLCFVVGLVILTTTDTPFLKVLLIAIALGVAAIPEGLPAVITLSLALGSKRMMQKHALLRKLPVAEGLGSVDIICTDKTGTLTENRMTVRRLYFGGRVIDVSGAGYSLDGGFFSHGVEVPLEELKPLLYAGMHNNNARHLDDGTFSGDPTEIALLVCGMKAGLRPKYRRVDEIAFSSVRKMMTTVHETKNGILSNTKGAPEFIIERCDRLLESGKVRKMSADDRARILKMNEELASQALRVIGFAYEEDTESPEEGMIFLGLQGMLDPPRKEVPAAIADCKSAGIRVIMITGDSKTTAQAIAREIGLDPKALEGREIDSMSQDQIYEAARDVSIFARVSPANKLAILLALKAQGHIVAMTGDGVNDAPAIKAADVGVSMGIRGTEVAKQTSDIVLLDDNFATIKDAILEGRRIFDNVRKFINYLFPCNLAEVLVVFIAALPFIAGTPLVILTAVQLLWINIATDGLPALALGVDPPAAGIMRRKPRPRGEGIINRRMAYHMVLIGVAMTAVILGLFYASGPLADFQRAQTIAFTAIVVFKMVRVYEIRVEDRLGLFSNKWLLLAVSSSVGLHLALLYSPAASYFKVVPLGLEDWGMVLAGMAAFAALSYAIRKMV
ncbi:MAG: calcium-translocating P-type ATPase, PMCA-type [Candidatus Altiarchaeota archaeon]